MTTPATASSFIWMQATRFSLSWTGAKLTGATATNTAPFQGSSSTLTEDGLRSARSQSPRTVGVWLFHWTPAARFVLPVATDPQSGCSYRCFEVKHRHGDWNCGSAVNGNHLPPHHTSIVYRLPVGRTPATRQSCHVSRRGGLMILTRQRPRRHFSELSFHIKILGAQQLWPHQCL